LPTNWKNIKVRTTKIITCIKFAKHTFTLFNAT
jgi:hypothetical protein